MTTSTKELPNTKSQFGEQLKIACPIYVNIGSSLAKEIINELRIAADHGDIKTQWGSASVVNNTASALEQRLKMDFRTLRFVLFDSWNRGIPLDLALRIQNELPNFKFIERELIDQAYETALANYEFYSDGQA